MRLVCVSYLLWPAQRSWRVIMFLPCPSGIRTSGQVKKICLKRRFKGFWVCFRCFWKFPLLSVRPSTFGQADGLCFVQRNCIRVLRFWNWKQLGNEVNIYWSCAPPIFGRPYRKSVCLTRVWTYVILHVALRQYAMFCADNLFQVSRFGVAQFTHYIKFTRLIHFTQFIQFTQLIQFMFFGNGLPQ